MEKEIRVGIIGSSSKRYNNVYREVLKKLKCQVYCWNRTKSKIKNIESFESVVDNLNDFEKLQIDLLLCFIPSNACYDTVASLNLRREIVVMIETPVTDTRWFDFKKFSVGVLEQWTYLPVEQFKQKVYESKLISKPYQMINDGRSFDYHAIAQMRSFCNNSTPSYVSGMMTRNISPGYVDFRGKNQFGPDEWCHGLCKLNDGTTIVHMFSYSCKLSVLKPLQLMRHCSVDGSIISGRNLEMENYYEMYKITYLKDGVPTISSVNRVEGETSGITKSISCKDANIFWDNDFYNLEMSDQETAIAYMIKDAAFNNSFRSTFDAYLDNLIIQGFKAAAAREQIVKFK